ncbi:phosphatase PAP2 family protein [Gordonia sp. CPCC 206044]|uniref:phosphatase PAP2 family protein n=1 Tax=Gordonia sp. CPCC 206044 TaxID=3140793 RepID=UPI003AF38507
MTGFIAARSPLSLPRALMLMVTLFAAAAGIFWVAVWTSPGQRIDQWLFDASRDLPALDGMPEVLDVAVVSDPLLWLVLAAVVVISVQIARARTHAGVGRGLAVTAALLVFPPIMIVVARVLRDDLLVRPHLHDWITQTENSAPSGHAAALTAAVVLLVLIVPPVLRPWVGLLGAAWIAVIDVGLITSGWHRPSDVLISSLLVVGAGVLLPDPWRAPARATVLQHPRNHQGAVDDAQSAAEDRWSRANVA